MIEEPMQEQASLYALGALDAAETPAFEQALRENPELRDLVRELRAVTEIVGGSAPALEPPAGVRERLMMQIGEAGRPRAIRTANVWVPWALAAGLAIVSFGLLYRYTDLKAQVALQAHRIEELGMSLEMAQSESGQLRQTVAKLRESNRLAAVRIALLDSLVTADPKAIAVSIWDNERQNGVFIVKNLKPAPTNKDYQLWIIDPKYASPVDAGVFQVDAKGGLRQEFRAKAPIESAKQFAVTIEKKGGADVPDTKAMVLAGA